MIRGLTGPGPLISSWVVITLARTACHDAPMRFPGAPLLAVVAITMVVTGCTVESSGPRAVAVHHGAPAIAVQPDTSPDDTSSRRGHGHVADNSEARSLGATLPEWTPVPGQKLTDMPVLRSRNGVLDFDLITELETIELAGSPIATTPYNGGFTGPTLQVQPGDTLNVDLANESGQITNIHYHGMHVSPRGKADNVFRMMDSGRTYRSTIHIPANHETALFWYHAHLHGNADAQVYGGMRGLLVVGDIVQRHLPQRFAGITEHLLSINDATTRMA